VGKISNIENNDIFCLNKIYWKKLSYLYFFLASINPSSSTNEFSKLIISLSSFINVKHIFLFMYPKFLILNYFKIMDLFIEIKKII
jgi:hypothetical protein